jgi:hypothetical protein
MTVDDSKLEHHRLSPEELKALPDKVKNYISALESDLESLEQRLHHNNDELRRKRFAYWKR